MSFIVLILSIHNAGGRHSEHHLDMLGGTPYLFCFFRPKDSELMAGFKSSNSLPG